MGTSKDVNARRLMGLPVTISVRLAERQVELKQMLSLSPGSLLTFDKSCDDLLDLYVNNQLYGRGEAVKIGEKFGLKINKIGDTL
ncbi:FliM/FliN family flagellar motor switch protein [Thalassoroseus pseudoceratinae]|uniref:FliM/FliN family flagellar motor switch protein n=1 Tax=Thalassoroseus pseudoceratinae TaxID=2713176 RepID=UPI001424609A|nr:FliM/FliN family flagellar motor switch protein [Thalassoroseus pseudoceratinae]